MKWQEKGTAAWVSDCGRYSICRVTYVTATGPQPRYEAWKRRDHPDGPGRLPGTFIAKAEAETAAEFHDATA
jgi:hypothetical protein